VLARGIGATLFVLCLVLGKFDIVEIDARFLPEGYREA
jgi:hypothetical protein